MAKEEKTVDQVTDIDALIKENNELKAKAQKVDNLEKVIQLQQEQIKTLQTSIQSSKALKIVKVAKKVRSLLSPRGVKRTVDLSKKGLVVLFKLGPKPFVRKIRTFMRQNVTGLSTVDLNEQYSLWVEKHRLTNDGIEAMKKELKTFKYQPKISIIVPVYNVDEKWLRLCVDSVINQIYPNWELCLQDDASPKPHIKPLLREFAQQDDRIKVGFSRENGHISVCSNEALKMATGEYIALMDNDDEIPANALFEYVKVLNANPDLDMMFSDEDLLTLEGKRVNPIFKPDWSPETTMSMMYTTHLGVYRKSIIDEIGGFRKGYEGSQDFDLVLRFSEKTTADKIYHIPQVLYHWRMIPGSTSVTYGEKSYAREAARKSIQDAVSRRKINAEVLDGNTLPSFRVKRKIDGNPLVSIVIPTKNKVELVKRCVESIQQKSTYHNYEIIIVDHESDDPKTVEWLKSIKDKVKVVPYKGVFNYSAINNYAIKEAAQGEQILLLNNDMEIISHDWIESMLEYSQLPEIGAVGARLLFPDGRVQHAGIILGICGPAGHSHKLFDRFANGYMDRIQIAQNIAAVTGACLMVKRSLFDEVNGLDEEHLAVAYNDVDFCLKLMEKGYRNIYTPFAELYHFESASRGLENSPEKIERLNREAEYMYKKWGEILKNDPFYNPNLSREREDFSLNMFD